MPNYSRELKKSLIKQRLNAFYPTGPEAGSNNLVNDNRKTGKREEEEEEEEEEKKEKTR